MPFIYQNTQVVTVSESSKKDLISLGLGKSKSIKIVHPGVDIDFHKPGIKTDNPSILYLGRLKAYKSIDVLIKAIRKVVKTNPTLTLKIAGFGEAREYLEKLVKTLGLQSHVDFLGRVTDEEKRDLMQKSWVFAYPSTKEGFGISAIEASACGTPVVASNVPGLRDSVRNPSTGFLVDVGDADAFAEKIELLLKDEKIRNNFSKNSVNWAKNFTWDKSARELLKLLKNTASEKRLFGSIPQIALLPSEQVI